MGDEEKSVGLSGASAPSLTPPVIFERCDGDVGGRVHREASDGFVSNYSQRGADRRSALAAAVIK